MTPTPLGLALSTPSKPVAASKLPVVDSPFWTNSGIVLAGVVDDWGYSHPTYMLPYESYMARYYFYKGRM